MELVNYYDLVVGCSQVASYSYVGTSKKIRKYCAVYQEFEVKFDGYMNCTSTYMYM